MRRRTFDRLVSTEGLVLAPVLAVAGGLLTWAQRYITNEVRNQLAAQKIYFPEADSPELAAAASSWSSGRARASPDSSA